MNAPPKPRRHNCHMCGQPVKSSGKGYPRYELDPPLREHDCKETPVSIDADPFEQVPRDRWGRPLIKQPDGGKAKAYTRCTTYVGCLEDTYNLAKWQQRMVALGLSARDDLLLSVGAHSDDKTELDKICEAAKEAAAASSGATKGTALHRIAERLDSGETMDIPTAAKADIKAYQAATAGVAWSHIERITVHDGLEVAGTPDRIGIAPGEAKAKVWDLKTGSIEFGMGKIAMQLAMYAHSQAYDPATGERTDLDVDLDWAVVIHLPAGSGLCSLIEVDIKAGWEAVQHATWVRGWRKRKNLSRPYPLSTAPLVETSSDSLASLIDRADSVQALTALWQANQHRWTAGYTALASARKTELTALAVAS